MFKITENYDRGLFAMTPNNFDFFRFLLFTYTITDNYAEARRHPDPNF